MGPTVEPQGESLRTTKACKGTFFFSATNLSRVEVTEVVAYLWLALYLMTTP
ncbi:hypothetical protein HMI55_001990 [Coelomomyces lativittatus]|nr:hypothetical protein HMI55_001990 [Coelomomyces lativittatus]